MKSFQQTCLHYTLPKMYLKISLRWLQGKEQRGEFKSRGEVLVVSFAAVTNYHK